MRAVVITRHGAPDVLQVQERPDPVPGAGEVSVAVAAVGVNFAEVMARMGLYASAPKPPCIVGYEVAGTIAALGSGVSEFAVGERVLAGTRFGGYAERVVARVGDVARLPEHLSFEEGAAIPVNYATAWASLRRYGNVQPGERVLIHAAAGGVGIAATQIARASGCEVWGTASPGKHDAIRAQGVEHALDYTKSGWERGVPGMDLVMDAIGGKSFRISYELLRSGGRLVCFGASAVVSGEKRSLVTALRTIVQMPRFNVMKQMEASKTVIGLNALALWDEFGDFADWVAPALDLVTKHGKRPVIAAAFPFDRAAEAHRMLSERRNVGKVVLVPR